MEGLAKVQLPEKIFVISLHRTMTRSTDALLSMAGLDTIHWPKSFQGKDLQEAVKGCEGDLDTVYSLLAPVLDRYDAFSDVPFPPLFPQLARDYPRAKFLLVHRDPFGWVESVRDHVGERELKPFEKVQYWAYLSSEIKNLRSATDQDLLGVYFGHLFAVYDFFEQRGELDRVCFANIADPKIGERVSQFLGLPSRPFPRIVGGQTDRDTLEAWLEADPENPDPHRVRVQVLEKEGRLEEAVAAAHNLVQKDPENPNTHRILARLLEKTGRTREMGKVAEKAVEAGTRSPGLHTKAAGQALKRGGLFRGLFLLARGLRMRLDRLRVRKGGSLSP